MVKKILCVLFVIVIFISATSCSNNKILVKNIEIEELLSSVELTYEYNVEDCCYTYKVYKDGIINETELNTEDKIIDYILGNLEEKCHINKVEQYKRFDYLTKINIQLEDDEYLFYIVDISKRPFSITFDYDDTNIGEKEYKIIDTVTFNDREYRYNCAIMETMSLNIVYNNAANIDMSEEGFINPFSHQMLLNILCGNYYIVIDTFYVDDIILEIMGIKKEEIKSNKSNFVCPRVDLTVERNVDYSKLKRYLENSRMIYGYKPVDFHYLYLLNGLFELEFNNCDEKQLACLDTEEYGCYYFVFGDTNPQITNWQISNIIKYHEEDNKINFDNNIKSMGIYIKFNNCICYSMTDGIFDIIPYICD